MLLFFDTETTGVPKNWKAPVTDVNNWPRLVQIAWLTYNDNGEHLSTECHIIKPEGFTIPKGASNVHGITTEKALREGENLLDILSKVSQDISNAQTLVAHNMSFDEKILGAEFIRAAQPNTIESKHKICTMLGSMNFCKIPGRYGNYKWPTLSELHTKLFNRDFDNAHDALADIQATANCFWELRKQTIL